MLVLDFLPIDLPILLSVRKKSPLTLLLRRFCCYVCQKQFTVKVGTVMEDSPIGLDKWMVAFWMLANCKNGISSYELGKAIGRPPEHSMVHASSNPRSNEG